MSPPPASPGREGTRAAPRSLLAYLLIPRPKDLTKAWVLPSTFLLGALATGGVSSGRLVRAVVVWTALELLIYQARYQWNDIRGFEADQRHPEAPRRGRLPGPIERGRPHKLASGRPAWPWCRDCTGRQPSVS